MMDIRGFIWITILLSISCAEKSISDSVINLSLAQNAGYSCFIRCVAKCIHAEKASNLENGSCLSQCRLYEDNELCNSTDDQCWSICKDLINTTGSKPVIPDGVTINYTSSPHEAELYWEKVADADLYLIQYLDKTDAFQKWAGDNGNLSVMNKWHFRKPSLCPEYVFRVASVNQFGVSAFSRNVVLEGPLPLIENFTYSVDSLELIEKPFVGVAQGDPTYNATVRLLINYTPPIGWDMATEMVRVSPQLHIINLPIPVGEPVAPRLRSVAGKAQIEVLLPGDLAYTDKRTIVLFAVTSLYTKCNPGRPYPYPIDEIPFIIDFNCADFDRSRRFCPGAEPIIPKCDLIASTKHEFECSNGTVINTTFTFTPKSKNESILYYAIMYGEVTHVDGAPLMPISAPFLNETMLKISADSTSFPMLDLRLNHNYQVCICAVLENFTEHLINWNITPRFAIDLSGPSNICGVGKTSADTTTVALTIPLALILLVAVLIVTMLWLKMRRQNAKSLAELADLDKNGNSNMGYDNGYVDMPRLYDRWEIPRSHLIVHDDQKLGSGAFGAVYKGKIRGRALMNKKTQSVLAENWMAAEDCDVAVKMLPEYADEGAKSEFRKEINLMKQLGYHERLVNMLCCITAEEPLCLIVEFCGDGDLLHYLRDRCKYMVKLQDQGLDLSDLPDDHDVDLNYVLSMKDLLQFSWQICVGLEYLSEKNYIHRDVAARNVMVDAGKRAKIGDFGLCRYSCSDPIYMGKGGRLPWKWMALEAIKDYEFTSKSDVWSFGVLLFEIVTLGGSPYPGIDPSTMEKYLDDGNRLAQPDNCPDEFYMIMRECWHADPEKRPTFSQLRDRLSKQLETITEDYSYLHLSQNRDYYNMYNSRQQYPTTFAPITYGDEDQFDTDHASRTSNGPNDIASTSFVNPTFVDGDGDRSNRHLSVIKSSSYPACDDSRRVSGDSGVTSDAMSVNSTEDNAQMIGIGARMHRDSSGSDQMLITSASYSPSALKSFNGNGSKLNKFLKFKPSSTNVERLDTLPESSTTSSSSGTNNRIDHSDIGALNPIYIDHLLTPDLLISDDRKIANIS